jgi:beta-N-acetylhexosaminidase
VIGVRSFGDDVERVKKYGLENIRGLQEHVIATAKHFPGHGDTSVDSHLDLPKIDKDLESLNALELAPFKAAIDQGVKAIMSSHINFPAITENGLPTTLSYHALTGLLRNKLGFSGLIITDCMQMKAIQTYYTTKKGTLMAIKAGADLVCISHSRDLQVEAIEYLKASVLNQQLPIHIVDERVSRILAFKKANIDLKQKQVYQDVKEIIFDQKAKDFALDVVRQAMTLVKGQVIQDLNHTLLIASEPISTTIADEDDGAYSIIKSVEKAIPNLETYKVSVGLDDDEISDILEKASSYKQVVFCSYNANIYVNQQKLMRQLNDLTHLHVIAMRNPYDSLFVEDLKNCVLLYEYTPNSIQVLIEYLKGELVPKGLSPVKL